MTAVMLSKIRKIGGSNGIIIPKEALAHINAETGDEITIVRTDNGLLIKVHDEQFMKTMENLDFLRRKYRRALAELAK